VNTIPDDAARAEDQARGSVVRAAWALLILLSITGVGWLDASVDPDVGFSLFYLVPVAVAAWRWGLGPAMAAACLAGVTRFISGLMGRGEGAFLLVLWNSMNHLAVFMATGLFVALLRRERTRLAGLLSRETENACTDPVTRLPNWRGLSEHLRREISRSLRHRVPLCVGYLDLDNFKKVNDRYGHGAGDKLLEKIGAVFTASIRPEDLAARVGGDEFVLVFNSPDPVAASRLGQRLIGKIESLGLEYPGCSLGASLGVACFHTPPEKPEELVSRADAAMYQAKNEKKGSVWVVGAEGRDRPGRWLKLENESQEIACQRQAER
jgi:diguanylate cyclase (GGDEF)-like protein